MHAIMSKTTEFDWYKTNDGVQQQQQQQYYTP